MCRLTDAELRILEKTELTCKDITALLGDFVDNELSLSLRDRVHNHLRSCHECQEGERQYREVIKIAQELPRPDVSEEVRARLREALNRRLGINLPVEQKSR